EDEWHVLFGCDASIQARHAAGIEHVIQPRNQQAGLAKDVIHAICSTVDKDTAEIFAMLVWVLWKFCEVWNDAHESGWDLSFKARHLWEEWAAIQHVQH
ncbi:hypothetical protein A2U01_0071877, partial [Trifolium medium]|nr:hypothetical protein [Trifolium medium]